jgi:hypothetical protein
MMTNVPRLYETESVPLEKKIVFQRYQIKEIGFYWLVTELNSEENLAFGYANLNNDDFAEWGNIDIGELLDNGAVLDREWKPCTFADALKKIAEEVRAESE